VVTEQSGDRASPELGAAFRTAMRRLAATVTIVTSAEGDRWHGITVTAVTSVSTDPPALLVCINQSSSLYAPLLARGMFCVNLLRACHADISSAFAGGRTLDERFRVGDWRGDASGIPYLADAQASLICRVADTLPYATHRIFIGRVETVRSEDAVTPLLYQDGGFHSSVPIRSE
jgi:flavin reductase